MKQKQRAYQKNKALQKANKDAQNKPNFKVTSRIRRTLSSSSSFNRNKNDSLQFVAAWST